MQKLLTGQVFAPKAQHQHPRGVGVAHQRGQQSAGLGMVGAGLAAAEGMGEGVQPLDAAGDQILIFLHQGLGAVVDAAHGGDDPDLVAHGGPAVGAAVAPTGFRLHRGGRGQFGGIGVLDLAGKVGLDVVGVHPGAGGGVGGGMADGKAVLDDVLPRPDGPDGHLVALGDVLGGGDGQAQVGHCHRGALGNRAQRHDHIVGRVDVNGQRHGRLLF